MARSLILAALAFGFLCSLAPVQADIWGYVPDVGPNLPHEPVEIMGTGKAECPPEDVVCQISCNLLSFEDGFSNPEFDPYGPKLVVPGPGPDGNQWVIGHWTLCVA